MNLSQEKLEALRSEYKHRSVRGRYPRQKMLPEYSSIYPWVIPDETDPYFTFCTICECRLSAKRSDLGKHEGSIKHTENAAKKNINALTEHKMSSLNDNNPNTCDETTSASQTEENTVVSYSSPDQSAIKDDDGPYIKQEPVIVLVENSNSISSLSDENSGDDNEQAYGEYEDDVVLYEPPSKRRVSETSSQSKSIDFLPTQTNYSLVSTREVTPVSISSCIKTLPQNGDNSAVTHYSPQTLVKGPPSQCKITIKKISPPTIAAIPYTQTLPPSTRLQPVQASISIAQCAKQFMSNENIGTTTSISSPIATKLSSQLSHLHPAIIQSSASANGHIALVRDSFDLFFDSICATVKNLPSKLATEAKIRVMQLIGELEMRAISHGEEKNKSAAEPNV